tara:strand:+ start:56 stop:550 length:495 start_codon:yes stop_codon:yes gene_type:complete
MPKSWSNFREEWLKSTSIPEEDAQWALEVLIASEEDFFEIDKRKKNNLDTFNQVKVLKKKVKDSINNKELGLDDISLSPSNSNKLQISVPSNLNYLLKVWAAAEGRDLSSVALQCLETGLREIKSKGSIPSVAIKRYDLACKKRIALAEVNHLLDKYESSKNKA